MSDRCNGCDLAELKKRYGKKLIKIGFQGWYLKGEQPAKGQGKPFKLDDGTPVRFVAWFMDEGHCC